MSVAGSLRIYNAPPGKLLCGDRFVRIANEYPGLFDELQAMHFVYILRCRDGSYYVGSTHDVKTRVRVHQSGKGPKFTANRLSVELVHQESLASLEEAVRRERQLKGWTRAKKETLIVGDKQRLRELATSRQSLVRDVRT